MKTVFIVNPTLFKKSDKAWFSIVHFYGQTIGLGVYMHEGM